jgi:hypothetical protein
MECRSGDTGRRHSVCRALEEEKVELLHLEVSNRPSRRPVSRGRSLIFLFSRSQGGADRPPPPPRLPRCLGQTRLSPRGGAHRGNRG